MQTDDQMQAEHEGLAKIDAKLWKLLIQPVMKDVDTVGTLMMALSTAELQVLTAGK